MAFLIVGNPDCPVQSVAKILSTSFPSKKVSRQEFLSLAKAIGLPESDVKSLEVLPESKKFREGFLELILLKWRNLNGNNATLCALIHVITTRLQWLKAAENLQKEFKINFDKSSKWADLDSQTKQALLQREVYFLGRRRRVAEICNNMNDIRLQHILELHLKGAQFLDFLKNPDYELVKNLIPPPPAIDYTGKMLRLLVENNVKTQSINETDFVDDHLLKHRSELILIAYGTDTGTPTFFSRIAKKVQKKHTERIMLYVELIHFVYHFNQNKLVKNGPSILKLLASLVSSKQLGCHLILEMLKTPECQVELFFTGFDEIADSSLDLTREILEIIQNEHKNIRMFVTLRPRHLELFELSSLQVLCFATDCVPENALQVPWKNPLAEVDAVLEETRQIQKRVDNFQGNSREDKEYQRLDELLTRCMINLDEIESKGREDVRNAKKECVAYIQSCVTKLEIKAPLLQL